MVVLHGFSFLSYVPNGANPIPSSRLVCENRGDSVCEYVFTYFLFIFRSVFRMVYMVDFDNIFTSVTRLRVPNVSVVLWFSHAF